MKKILTEEMNKKYQQISKTQNLLVGLIQSQISYSCCIWYICLSSYIHFNNVCELLTIFKIHQYITSPVLQGVVLAGSRSGGGFRILSDMHKIGGELPKSLISPWLLEFTGVKVGLMFE